MFQPLPLAIGLRYLRARRRDRRISFTSALSILGIVVGVAALITVIAVMSGFQREIRDRLLGSVAHVTLVGFGGPLDDWPDVVAMAKADPRVVGAAPYVQREGLLTGNRTSAALVMGIDPEAERGVSELAQRMREGRIDDLVDGGFGVVLGEQLAIAIGARVGDRVNLTLNEFSSTPLGAIPRSRRFTVVGTFSMGEHTADSSFAFVALGDAQRMLRLGEGVSGVRVKVSDLWAAGAVADDLALRADQTLRASDWMRDNRNFFSALALERTVMFLLLSLVVTIASVNLVSSLVMLVQEKQADIAILRTLGLTPRQVMGVFIVQGSVIGVVGTALGVVGGVLLALNLGAIVRAVESVLGVALMPADVYYITGVPTAVYPADVAAVAALTLALSFLATLYPAWRASRTDPATALRYE
ncbi:MAG TPA: lipoprotein-releasing ABC transporter permease subunit [Xanthomonadaceae bacterium]|nr:lipoprotein-releasing ABC transporter permease subunit [Xanthomonadaceae bacterium]